MCWSWNLHAPKVDQSFELQKPVPDAAIDVLPFEKKVA